MTLVGHQLKRIFEEYKHLQEPLGWPQERVESDWLSPCFIGTPLSGQDHPWCPVVNQDDANTMFKRLGDALNESVPESIANYYDYGWSQCLRAKHPQGELSLIFVWNQDDMERLRANLIGHALNKRKLKQPISYFFATTEPDGEKILSVEGQSGRVLLERPGRKDYSVVSESLALFLEEVHPLTF